MRRAAKFECGEKTGHTCAESVGDVLTHVLKVTVHFVFVRLAPKPAHTPAL